jgi:hypothetical protein
MSRSAKIKIIGLCLLLVFIVLALQVGTRSAFNPNNKFYKKSVPEVEAMVRSAIVDAEEIRITAYGPKPNSNENMVLYEFVVKDSEKKKKLSGLLKFIGPNTGSDEYCVSFSTRSGVKLSIVGRSVTDFALHEDQFSYQDLNFAFIVKVDREFLTYLSEMKRAALGE